MVMCQFIKVYLKAFGLNLFHTESTDYSFISYHLLCVKTHLHPTFLHNSFATSCYTSKLTFVLKSELWIIINIALLDLSLF